MDNTETTQSDDIAPDDGMHPTCGERLKQAREQRGLSLKDVAATTRQSLDLLAALEAMETDHIAPTILRMQAGSYAAFLGLPSGEIAAGYSKLRSAPDSTNMPAEKLRTTQLETRRRLWPLGLAAAALVVAGIAFWAAQASPGQRAATPVASKIVVPPASSPIANSPTQAAVKPELSIRAVTSAWIEVRGSDGTIFRNRSMSAGEVYYPRMDAAWTVTVRDAGAFEWWLGENLVGPLGELGAPIYSVSIDAATQRGLEQLSTALAEADAQTNRPR